MSTDSTKGSWATASAAYEAAIRQYAVSLGQDPQSTALDTTIRTNTVLVPQRTEDLLTLLREAAGIDSVAGMRVLDLGCGWGSMATYIALEHRPASVTGIDNREDFLEAAAGCTKAAGVNGIEYIRADMTSLEPLADDSFDLLIANNALPYVITRERLDQVARAAFRVGAPGAVLIGHQANRWQLRDPFTDAPLVHLLSPQLAERVERRTGWRNSHDRLRLFGPAELSRSLRDAQFQVIEVASIGTGHRITRGLKARTARYYAVTARKP